jgi:hypothetical protein
LLPVPLRLSRNMAVGAKHMTGASGSHSSLIQRSHETQGVSMAPGFVLADSTRADPTKIAGL